jgi:hypothetical protein
VGDEPRGIAIRDFVWVANHGDGTVSKITPKPGRPRDLERCFP